MPDIGLRPLKLALSAGHNVIFPIVPASGTILILDVSGAALKIDENLARAA